MYWNLKELFPKFNLIGLTGGIASGKSAVAGLLGELGAVNIDCDRLYHQLLASSQALQADLAYTFGTSNRQLLAEMVFGNPELLPKLNHLTHPYVAEALIKELEKQQPKAPVIIEATLLYESGLGYALNKSIAVTAPYALRLERLMARNKLSKAQAEARIKAQSPDQFRTKLATWVIANDGDMASLKSAVQNIWNEIVSLQKAQSQDRGR